MMPRTDGRAFEREARVDPDLCVSCGICAGACPTSMPFRRATELVPGIDLPSLSMATLRDRVDDAAAGLTQAPRIVVFGCDQGVELTAVRGPQVAALSLACIGQLPPAFIDYVLSRDLADGVLLTGCADGVCFNRFGIAWTEARLAGERDPHLRARVPRERLTTRWLGRHRVAELERALQTFARNLEQLGTPRIERRSPAPAAVELGGVGHG
jgi:coenzyme F420-reducing hydrogenase delta subunit